MVSMKNFPNPAPVGHVTVCEVDGKLQTMTIENANFSIFSNTVASYPTIVVNRDLLRPSVTSHEDVNAVFLPVREGLVKKILNVWYEHGLLEALNLMADQNDPNIHPTVRYAASSMLKLSDIIIRLRNRFHPRLTESGTNLIAAVSQTRDWSRSPVRCLAWHPHCTKLAVAVRDDSVHIYTAGSKHKPFLKYKNQKNISSLAWRPLSASELAVGCEAGVYVWHIDPNSVVTRLSANCATFLERPNHSPITSVAWSPQGDVLVTASAADTVMYAWDLAMESYSAIRKTHGGGVSFIAWSPEKVFSATTGVVFRVWETNTWTSEQWTLPFGHVKTACWSPCGSVLLFATSHETVIYSLSFIRAVTVFLADAEKASRTAIPVADVTPSETDTTGDRIGGLPVSIVWDGRGQYVAVLFKESRHIAVFKSKLKPVFQLTPCCFISGISDELPNAICFQNNYEEGALLTIAWSTGRIQYFPFINSSAGTKDAMNVTHFSGHLDSTSFHSPTIHNLSTFRNASFASF
ncbi:aladin-like [Schistocerca piceifrons]|uniref:aladin-like n=1 Tax=Schistocerca piceifrons TaxID=274613 RepID=UPI001F5F12D2|nr:aladin-like [Schistocerca piceifrons]